VDAFDTSGGSVGSWFSDIAGKFLDYKAKTTPQPGIRWLPYGADGTQFGIAPDGSLIQRGASAPVGGLSNLAGLLPLLLLAGLAYFVFRALK
jgi:hypothetical protein